LTQQSRCLRRFCDSSRLFPVPSIRVPSGPAGGLHPTGRHSTDKQGQNKKERPLGRSLDRLLMVPEPKKCSAVTLGLPLRFLRNSINVSRGGRTTQGLEPTFSGLPDHRSLRLSTGDGGGIAWPPSDGMTAVPTAKN